MLCLLRRQHSCSPAPYAKNTRASAGRYSIGLKIFFEDFLKYPSEIQVPESCPQDLPWASSGFALDDLESQSIQHLSSTIPAPRCTFCSGSPASADFALDGVANTAAATSLTSFINVPRLLESRKSLTHYFQDTPQLLLVMHQRDRSFGRFSGFLFWLTANS